MYANKVERPSSKGGGCEFKPHRAYSMPFRLTAGMQTLVRVGEIHSPVLPYTRTMRKRTWSDEDLVRAVEKSVTWGQVARAVGLKNYSGTGSRTIRARAAELELDTSHFLGKSWNKGQGAGRDPVKAREHKRRWYENNRQVYRDRNRARFKENARKLREAKKRPCMDCEGRFPPFCMDFDHRDGATKMGNIGNLLKTWSWSRLQTEIDKCDLICANCHRIRTARRAGWPDHDDDLKASA